MTNVEALVEEAERSWRERFTNNGFLAESRDAQRKRRAWIVHFLARKCVSAEEIASLVNMSPTGVRQLLRGEVFAQVAADFVRFLAEEGSDSGSAKGLQRPEDGSHDADRG